MPRTAAQEFVQINLTFSGQDAVAAVAARWRYVPQGATTPFAIGDDTTQIDPEHFLDQLPFDGTVIIAIIRALFDGLTGLGVNCLPSGFARAFRERNELVRSIMRNKQERKLRRISRDMADESEKLFDLLESRADQHDDERLRLAIEEIQAAERTLFG